jgi:hypothetical protein
MNTAMEYKKKTAEIINEKRMSLQKTPGFRKSTVKKTKKVVETEDDDIADQPRPKRKMITKLKSTVPGLIKSIPKVSTNKKTRRSSALLIPKHHKPDKQKQEKQQLKGNNKNSGGGDLPRMELIAIDEKEPILPRTKKTYGQVAPAAASAAAARKRQSRSLSPARPKAGATNKASPVVRHQGRKIALPPVVRHVPAVTKRTEGIKKQQQQQRPTTTHSKTPPGSPHQQIKKRSPSHTVDDEKNYASHSRTPPASPKTAKKVIAHPTSNHTKSTVRHVPKTTTASKQQQQQQSANNEKGATRTSPKTTTTAKKVGSHMPAAEAKKKQQPAHCKSPVRHVPKPSLSSGDTHTKTTTASKQQQQQQSANNEKGATRTLPKTTTTAKNVVAAKSSNAEQKKKQQPAHCKSPVRHVPKPSLSSGDTNTNDCGVKAQGVAKPSVAAAPRSTTPKRKVATEGASKLKPATGGTKKPAAAARSKSPVPKKTTTTAKSKAAGKKRHEDGFYSPFG